jgi:hypothetical protein
VDRPPIDTGSEAPSVEASGDAPFRAGPVSSLLAWATRQPGRGWWVYLAVGIAVFGWGQGVEWALGRVPLGTIDPNLAVLVPYGPYVLVGLALASRIATRALDAFWPATGRPVSDRPAWAYRFTRVPLDREVLGLLVGGAGGVVALLGSPASILGPEAGRTAVYLAYLPAFVVGYALAIVGAIATLEWLRQVARIQGEATNVDPFDRTSIYAFSRLTALVGVSYLIAVSYSLTVNAAFQQGNVASIVFIGGSMVFAVLAFTLPMLGIHGRLVREKEALVRDTERRINQLVAELYARIDDGRFDATKELSDSMAGVSAHRDRLGRLPTWPWPPEVVRGFISALVLPLAIYILTRVISALI